MFYREENIVDKRNKIIFEEARFIWVLRLWVKNLTLTFDKWPSLEKLRINDMHSQTKHDFCGFDSSGVTGKC